MKRDGNRLEMGGRRGSGTLGGHLGEGRGRGEKKVKREGVTHRERRVGGGRRTRGRRGRRQRRRRRNTVSCCCCCCEFVQSPQTTFKCINVSTAVVISHTQVVR